MQTSYCKLVVGGELMAYETKVILTLLARQIAKSKKTGRRSKRKRMNLYNCRRMKENLGVCFLSR